MAAPDLLAAVAHDLGRGPPALPQLALQEVAGNAAVFTDELASGIRQALADRARLSAAGLERVRAFSWRETARITADVYRTVLAT